MYLRLKCSVKQKEKRRVEKEYFNFWNKSQAAELPEKGKLFPGRANHGVKPVPNLGSTATRVGRDLTLPSSPLCGLLSCCSEDHNGYRFQPPCLYSTKYPFLHPLRFSPLGWQFTYPYCSFPRDRVSAYAKRKLPCSLGEGVIPHGSWKDAAIGILDPELCSVVMSGWPQHKERNGFRPRLLKEGMCLNPRRFLQPPAETGNRGLGGIFSTLLCCSLEEWGSTQGLLVVSSHDRSGSFTEKGKSGPIPLQMSQMRTLGCRESTGPGAGAVSSRLPRREVVKWAENCS